MLLVTLPIKEYVCLVFFCGFFAHNAMVSKRKRNDLQGREYIHMCGIDSIYAAHVDISNLKNPSSSVTEANIQPGVVFLTRYRLVDGVWHQPCLWHRTQSNGGSHTENQK